MVFTKQNYGSGIGLVYRTVQSVQCPAETSVSRDQYIIVGLQSRHGASRQTPVLRTGSHADDVQHRVDRVTQRGPVGPATGQRTIR